MRDYSTFYRPHAEVEAVPIEKHPFLLGRYRAENLYHAFLVVGTLLVGTAAWLALDAYIQYKTGYSIR